ncbi:phosphoribosylformylglycinamidine cyclo-ligase [Actinopolymorpha alba]|uniref:phosphoribosylformylglycinamidine cyclo-ligase n=1 Tax=Actinopolymorpha alba TaxID=533267 RepID=UPI00058F6450|nr:phosphoribosylformylglycinamidine cyclo-ligase [Actinopolymorpha alba]
MGASRGRGASYAEAGVDIEAGDRAVALMRDWIEKTRRPEVVGGVGGFAGLFDASALRSYRRPLLATSTDGVGTKVAIAQALDKHDTIGFDLIGMLVDDLVVCGAEPLFLTDYIACGKVVPERIAQIVKGIAEACVVAGCALIGGETAEHAGLLEPDEYDVAGATTGVVEADEVLGPDRVRAGDVVVAMASSGLHSNGYSLVRHVIREAGWTLDRHVDDFGRTLGEELLEPTRVYAKDCLALARETGVHAMAHITGGGLAANTARVVPAGLEVALDRSTWSPPRVFSLLGELGGVEQAELERTFNMGVGMLAMVDPRDADAAVGILANRGIHAWIAGSVFAGEGSAHLAGSYGRS